MSNIASDAVAAVLVGRKKRTGDEAAIYEVVKLEAQRDELLAALQGVLSWHDFSDDLHKPVEVRAAYMRAKAAIAKAKGE